MVPWSDETLIQLTLFIFKYHHLHSMKPWFNVLNLNRLIFTTLIHWLLVSEMATFKHSLFTVYQNYFDSRFTKLLWFNETSPTKISGDVRYWIILRRTEKLETEAKAWGCVHVANPKVTEIPMSMSFCSSMWLRDKGGRNS